MSSRQIEEYLNRTMGLDPDSIGQPTLERALRTRLTATGLDVEGYCELLQRSKLETQELVEALVVPETWFFRDGKALRALVTQACQDKPGYQPGRPLKILSLPCATGEEPYSIAMALLDARFPAAAFRIDAWDISLRALQTAAMGRYGKNSFRGNDVDFRDRHFDRVAADYRLHDEVRAAVNFRHANILALDGTPPDQRYDAVFCRNMLIYFDRLQQQRAVQALAQLLAPNGTLYTGASESTPVLRNGFFTARISGVTAFRRAEGVVVTLPTRPLSQERASGRDATPPMSSRPSAPKTGPRVLSSHTTAVSARPAPPPLPEDWVSTAQELANRGEIAAAMRVCEANLQLLNSSAQGLYVKALLHDAIGEPDLAVAHYRKALYLDPGHRDALEQLAAALLRKGDDAGARHLFERASRLGTGGS